MHVVILAGGGGTRLWPLSRTSRPKQFQNILGRSTLLELTRERIGNDFPDENIFYSVTPETAGFVRDIFPNLTEDHILVEPEKRDTGPAMGFVAAILALTAPDEPLAFLPSDHYISDYEQFRTSLHVAAALIQETGKLLDIGITPTWANTNLGYTHIGRQMTVRDGISVHAFQGHTEKPSQEIAEQYIASGEYLWHGNYYMWTPRKFLEAYKTHAPQTAAALHEIQQLWKSGKRDEIPGVYRTLEKISIDYAITEKLHPDDVLILKAPFAWSDVGLWSELKHLQEENAEANVVHGANHVSVDTVDTLIYGPEKKTIATLGVSDLIIVDTDDALLIADKKRDQDVKRIVEKLKEEKREDLL